MNAEEVIAKRLTTFDPVLARSVARSALLFLKDAGYTVARLEQVGAWVNGWGEPYVGESFNPDHEPLYRLNDETTKAIRDRARQLSEETP